MGHVKLYLTNIFLCISLTACYQFEMEGFVRTDTDVNERFEQSIANNTTINIEVDEDHYTLYAMGDSHVGSTENIDWFFSSAINNKALATILIGDLVTGHAEDYATFVQHIPEQDSLHIFPLVGNHELYFEGWSEFYKYWGSSSYYFTINSPQDSDLFICLDTGSGTLGEKQLVWLENTLNDKRHLYRHCIVFTHNNIFRLRHMLATSPMVEEVQVLTDLFVRYTVDMVVNGHDHIRNTAVLGHTTYIVMDALKDSNKKASFLSLSIGEKITYQFVEK